MKTDSEFDGTVVVRECAVDACLFCEVWGGDRYCEHPLKDGVRRVDPQGRTVPDTCLLREHPVAYWVEGGKRPLVASKDSDESDALFERYRAQVKAAEGRAVRAAADSLQAQEQLTRVQQRSTMILQDSRDWQRMCADEAWLARTAWRWVIYALGELQLDCRTCRDNGMNGGCYDCGRVASGDNRQRCVIGEYCFSHGFIHGAEADELREAIEKLADATRSGSPAELQRVLDTIDARDSLAYLESQGDDDGAADVTDSSLPTRPHHPSCPGEGRGCTLDAPFSSAQLCRLRGWGPGALIVGDEGYGPETSCITAVGKQSVLACDGHDADCDEYLLDLTSRCWGDMCS